MKKVYIPFAAVVVALVLAVPALADVPMLLNYQGRLTDPSGNPKNGTFTMQFAVYDAETGGNQLPTGTPWSETQSVTVTNGVFNVLLGSATALPATLFQGGPSDASGPLRFLEVTVSGEVLTPRRRIVSAAYALGDVAGALPASYASGVITHTSSTTQSIATSFATSFTPKIITIYYRLSASTTFNTVSSGIAVFDGTTYKAGFIPEQGVDANPPVIGHGLCTVGLGVTSVTSSGFTITEQYNCSGTPTITMNEHWFAVATN